MRFVQPQTVKIARRLVRQSDPLSRNASLRSGVAARGRVGGQGEEERGAGEDAEFVSALFAFAVGLSQNCMAPQSGPALLRYQN